MEPVGPGHGSGDQRTALANVRTLLAWWRTGLGSLALAVGVGRLLPEVTNDSLTWDYMIIGCAFAIYGVALILYGSHSSRLIEERFNLMPMTFGRGVRVLAAFGVVLGLAIFALILVR